MDLDSDRDVCGGGVALSSLHFATMNVMDEADGSNSVGDDERDRYIDEG
jgi:hypothetical protein